jgi:Double jelly roll-like domain
MTTQEIANDSLNILEVVKQDNSIESWQYIGYTPQSQDNINTLAQPILIEINASDNYIIPGESELYIKGQLVRNDNNPYGANDEIALVNNAMMYLFSDIRYSIGNINVECINNPGQVTSMLTYLSQPDDYSTSSGLLSCWNKDTTNHASSSEFTASGAVPAAGYRPARNVEYNQGFAARRGLLMSANPRGSFSFIIPFRHMFGFGDYTKAIYNIKHKLTLTRMGSDNLAIHRGAGVVDGKIRLTNITWRVPHIRPEVVILKELRDVIESKHNIPVTFTARTCESTVVPQSRNFSWRINVTSGVEKPRWLIVGFQTSRIETQEQNSAVFDHLNLQNAYVAINGERYPLYDVISDFPANDYSILYKMFDNFKKEFHGFNSLVGGTQVNFAAFKSLFPILVFDVRHQSERLKSGIADIQLKCTFGDNVPANTTAYVVSLSDRMYQLKSDGKNLSMVSY